MAEFWTKEIGGRVWMNSARAIVGLEVMEEDVVGVEVGAGVVSMMTEAAEQVGVIAVGVPGVVVVAVVV
jgi:hypothetical protein